jgi:hypothetical protein
MHKFYFNECLPGSVSEKEFVSLFSKTIIEFDTLINRNIGIEKSIVTEKQPSKIFINEINLGKIFDSIVDKSIKNLAFRYFTKSPIGKSFDIDTDILLSENYMFKDLDALNLAIVAMNNGFLFSVAIDYLLKKDKLELCGINNKLGVYNLYGEQINTAYIKDYIITENTSKLNTYNQLIAELINPIICSNFKKSFLSEKNEIQQSIIHAFKEARNRNLVSPYYPDTNIIKDVTPNSNKKAKVFELRVRYPKELRVYFYESVEKVYIAKIGYKADYKEDGSAQTKEINTIHQVLHTMVLTE